MDIQWIFFAHFWNIARMCKKMQRKTMLCARNEQRMSIFKEWTNAHARNFEGICKGSHLLSDAKALYNRPLVDIFGLVPHSYTWPKLHWELISLFMGNLWVPPDTAVAWSLPSSGPILNSLLDIFVTFDHRRAWRDWQWARGQLADCPLWGPGQCFLLHLENQVKSSKSWFKMLVVP